MLSRGRARGSARGRAKRGGERRKDGAIRQSGWGSARGKGKGQAVESVWMNGDGVAGSSGGF